MICFLVFHPKGKILGFSFFINKKYILPVNINNKQFNNQISISIDKVKNNITRDLLFSSEKKLKNKIAYTYISFSKSIISIVKNFNLNFSEKAFSTYLSLLWLEVFLGYSCDDQKYLYQPLDQSLMDKLLDSYYVKDREKKNSCFSKKRVIIFLKR